MQKELYYKYIGVKQLKSSEWNYQKTRNKITKKSGKIYICHFLLVILHSNSRNT